MASVEKIKKKKGGKKVSPISATLNVKDDQESMSDSVVSVKEAASTDQHDTVEKGSAEQARTKSPPPRSTSANSQRPPSANSQRPLSANSQRPPSPNSQRPPSANSQRQAPSAGPSGLQRLPSPQPDLGGSMASLKSRQAWGELDNTQSPPNTRPSTAVSRTAENRDSPVHFRSATNTSGSHLFRPNNAVSPLDTLESTSSRPATSSSFAVVTSPVDNSTSIEPYEPVSDFGQTEMNESHAYVPYVYARDAISKIMADMKNMKTNHIRIVRDIEGNFRCIEDETQAQFNMFVLNLRDQYGIKVKTFRQVIDVHRLELQQKDQYWDELLMSLSQRNTELLRDKKLLLIQNKVEFERLEREKKESVVALTAKLDETNATNAKSLKEIENSLEEQKKEVQVQHDAEVTTQRQEHERVMHEAVETEKVEVKHLQSLLAEMQTEKEAVATLVATEKTVQPINVVPEAAVMVADMSEADRTRMEETRRQMASEREAMVGDRKSMQEERAELANQRLKFHEDSVLLQDELNTVRKECEEWRMRYESLRAQLGDFAQLRAEHEALSAQFAAISSLAVAAAVDDKTKTNERIAKLEADRDMMLEEKIQMDRDIAKWEVDFKKNTGHEPTEADMPDSIRELHSSRAEAETMVQRLDAQIEALRTLLTGAAPLVAVGPVTPLTVHEPQINTIEVKVPDPEVVKSLREAETQVDQLRAKMAASMDEQSELRGSLSHLESELEQARAEIRKSEVQITSLQEKLTASKGASAVVEPEAEVTALKAEVTALKAEVATGASLHPVAMTTASSSGDDFEELNGQLSELQRQIDETETQLAQEKSAHAVTRDELDTGQAQLEALKAELEEKEAMHAASINSVSDKRKAEITNLTLKLKAAEKRLEELDKDRMSKVPVDTRKEIKSLKANLAAAVKEKDDMSVAKIDLEAEINQMKVKLAALEKSSNQKKASSTESDKLLREVKAAKDKELREAVAKYKKREQERVRLEEKKVGALEKKVQALEAAGDGASAAKGHKAGPDKATLEKLRESQREVKDAQSKVKQLEKELKDAQKSSGSGSVEAEREKKKQEKVLKELEKKLDMLMKKDEKNESNLKKQADQLDAVSKEIAAKDRTIAKLTSEVEGLGGVAAAASENAAKVKELSSTVKKLTEESKEMTDNYNSERVLRKKYFNMVEDMKGKIRVFCRVRPMSSSEKSQGCKDICKSPDEYTIQVERAVHGTKEYQFDNIFMPAISQERIFEDTNNLVQSAVDGYNVCIFAYGQTGSGKTYTVIGDSAGRSPGIAPRAFDRIYALAEEQKSKFSFKVSVYMLELYNDRLLDLFAKSNPEDKMEIKKDKKGMVVVKGAEVKIARNTQELTSLFQEGSKNRHVASTKMNAESSRSHLVIGIVIESTNKVSGQLTKGKLSLVDLAGSERAAKTEASAEQLKEAMSINKSLSALGDVISALSSEQSFIPYRNNKLTMLMQDSLGGNAKTLMFVNVSPADYNADETVTSLTYAARVKLITNDASKNADNKEIARLKSIITKLQKGETVGEDDVDGGN